MTCQQTTTDAKGQMPDILKQHLSVSWSVCLCLFVSVGVCWYVVFLGDTTGLSGGCLKHIWVVFIEIGGARMCLGGYVGSQSIQYGAKTLFRHSPERHNFCHLTILRHWNIKMVAYKLSKKYWVMHFIAIFRPVREKLLVTVALDHPVVALR